MNKFEPSLGHGTNQVLLEGVSGGFSRGTHFSPHLLIESSGMSEIILKGM